MPYNLLKLFTKNTDFNFKNVEKLCDDFFNTFTEEQWKVRGDNAKKAEQRFMDNEPTLDIVLDDLIVNIGNGNDNDSESGSDTNASHCESDCED